MRVLARTAVLGLVLFAAQFGATHVTYRYLTDDTLNEDQKLENIGLLFGPVLYAHIGLALVMAAGIVFLFSRRA